jgi:glutathione synthase/RimK-type ligase-like ATP-grasp enzyme
VTVLLLTHSGDFDVPDRVAHALEHEGARAIRVDTDRFPASASLSVSSEDHGLRASLLVAEREIDLLRCRAVWCRRLWPAAGGVDVDPRWAAACAAQARDAFFGALALLEDELVVINRPGPQARAEHKVVQLRAARAAGLTLPPTLVTNDPAAARAFVDEHRDVVTKMLVPLSASMDGSGPFVYTSAVDDGDMRHIEGLRPAPMIFQRRVEKREELRVVVVGDQVFAAAVTPSSLDWRTGTGSAWRRAELSTGAAGACVKLVKDLGLVTGALDFIVDTHGALVFLEVNPAGEWGFVERETGLPIAAALARALLSPRGRA